MSDGLELRFPPEPEQVRSIRNRIRSRLMGLQIPQDLVDSVLLVTDEVVSNAIEHADEYRDHDASLVVRLQVEGADVVLEFEDPDVPIGVVRQLAAALAAPDGQAPPPDSERGRGLFLIAHHVDHIAVSERPGGGMCLRGRFTEGMA